MKIKIFNIKIYIKLHQKQKIASIGQQSNYNKAASQVACIAMLQAHLNIIARCIYWLYTSRSFIVYLMLIHPHLMFKLTFTSRVPIPAIELIAKELLKKLIRIIQSSQKG